MGLRDRARDGALPEVLRAIGLCHRDRGRSRPIATTPIELLRGGRLGTPAHWSSWAGTMRRMTTAARRRRRDDRRLPSHGLPNTAQHRRSGYELRRAGRLPAQFVAWLASLPVA
jgi:hypothetical protein